MPPLAVARVRGLFIVNKLCSFSSCLAVKRPVKCRININRFYCAHLLSFQAWLCLLRTDTSRFFFFELNCALRVLKQTCKNPCEWGNKQKEQLSDQTDDLSVLQGDSWDRVLGVRWESDSMVTQRWSDNSACFPFDLFWYVRLIEW